jgi:DMSO/TMAO reductase YedYZ molybdopterin-dependent catalytic subunit
MDKKNRVPPGQIVTKIFPVLSATDVPEIDLKNFKFRVFRRC